MFDIRSTSRPYGETDTRGGPRLRSERDKYAYSLILYECLTLGLRSRCWWSDEVRARRGVRTVGLVTQSELLSRYREHVSVQGSPIAFQGKENAMVLIGDGISVCKVVVDGRRLAR
jgi:hypothetical protein